MGVDPAIQGMDRLKASGDVRANGISSDDAGAVDYHRLYIQHRASSAQESEGLLRHIQELEDALVAEPTVPPPVVEGDGASDSDPRRASVLRRIVRTARILRRDWRSL
jgi:hypothetical protein